MTSEETLKEGLCILGVETDNLIINKLLTYAQFIIRSNESVNLTAPSDEKNFIIRHILDSIAPISFFPKNASVIDIGSGGGFPSIPLACLREDLRITSCESKTKKSNIQKEAVKILCLNNITVLNKNAFEIKEKYDIITARAYASTEKLVKLLGKITHGKGKVLAYKGRLKTIEEELKKIKGDYNIKIIELEVPFLNEERHLVSIAK